MHATRASSQTTKRCNVCGNNGAVMKLKDIVIKALEIDLPPWCWVLLAFVFLCPFHFSFNF